MPIPASLSFYLCPFHMQQQYSFNVNTIGRLIEKSVNGVLGILTQGLRMVLAKKHGAIGLF